MTARWQAIAWAMVSVQPGSALAGYLGEDFARLSAGDKLRCRAELHACRQAARGRSIAELKRIITQ